jgi:hypothetical protein
VSTVVIGPVLRPGEDGLPGVRQPGHRFGASLVGYAFDEDHYHDLAIGTPGDGGGRVYVIPGAPGGLDLAHGTSFAQDTPEILDDDGLDDEFGAAVGAMRSGSYAVVVVGAPGEDAGQGATVLLRMIKNPATGAFVAAEPATVFRPVDVGVQDTTFAQWGRTIAPPHAFPTIPAEYPV